MFIIPTLGNSWVQCSTSCSFSPLPPPSERGKSPRELGQSPHQWIPDFEMVGTDYRYEPDESSESTILDAKMSAIVPQMVKWPFFVTKKVLPCHYSCINSVWTLKIFCFYACVAGAIKSCHSCAAKQLLRAHLCDHPFYLGGKNRQQNGSVKCHSITKEWKNWAISTLTRTVCTSICTWQKIV